MKTALQFAANTLASAPVATQSKLTVEEIAAIHLYSLEGVEFYKPLNAALLEHSRELVKVYFPFIRLLCTGLDKIPCYGAKSSGKTYLYRGMPATEEIILTYTPGKSFQWWNFLSTSKKRDVALKFAERDAHVKGAVGGVLFRIECDVGLPIAKYSKFPAEDEVLLKPGLTYRVTKVTDNKTQKGFFSKIFNKTSDSSTKIWVIDVQHDTNHKCFLQTLVS